MRNGSKLLILSVILMLLLPAFSFAQDLTPKYQYCLLCHGSAGQGNSVIQAPAIVGIDEFYLRQQLENYRALVRGGDYKVDAAAAEMAAVARDVADDETSDIAEFLDALTKQQIQHDVLEGDVDAGKVSYSQICSACHGSAAEGNDLLKSPALVHLNDWYLVSSFNKYIDGSRGDSAKDVSAQQMRAIVSSLPEGFSIEDIAAYIRSINVNSVSN